MKFLSFFLANLFTDGGIEMMSLILFCLLFSIFFLIKAYISLNKNHTHFEKMLRLASDASLLGLVLGFLGSILGWIAAFDALEGIGSISPAILAGGLKISLITTLFGSIVFVVSRIGILILRSLQKV